MSPAIAAKPQSRSARTQSRWRNGFLHSFVMQLFLRRLKHALPKLHCTYPAHPISSAIGHQFRVPNVPNTYSARREVHQGSQQADWLCVTLCSDAPYTDHFLGRQISRMAGGSFRSNLGHCDWIWPCAVDKRSHACPRTSKLMLCFAYSSKSLSTLAAAFLCGLI